MDIDIHIDTINTSRPEIVSYLITRDGFDCAHPDCGEKLDQSIPEGPYKVTIDHWIPQWYGRDNGWTPEQIWAPSNLKAMHRKCNAKKGELLPNDDGTLPPKPISTFQLRAQKRSERPEVCQDCNSGRFLSEGEECLSCGSGPQPASFPKWRQLTPKECDHDLFFCVSCTVWFPNSRKSELDTLMSG